MNVIRKTYVPNICISYTLIVLFTAAINLINGNSLEGGFMIWLLELGAFLVIVGTVDYLISKINFNHWFIVIVVEFIVNFIVFLLGAYFLHWFNFNMEGLFTFTVIFVIVFSAVYYNSYLLLRKDEEYLNELIKIKKNS